MTETVGEALPFLDEMLESHNFIEFPALEGLDGEGSRYSQRLLERTKKLYAPSSHTNPAEQINGMYFRNSADEPSATQPTIIEGIENDEDHVQDIDEGRRQSRRHSGIRKAKKSRKV